METDATLWQGVVLYAVVKFAAKSNRWREKEAGTMVSCLWRAGRLQGGLPGNFPQVFVVRAEAVVCLRRQNAVSCGDKRISLVHHTVQK